MTINDFGVKVIRRLFNVFIGSNVKVMKGVSIGNNSVIANGSIVTRSIPENVLTGGVPAKVIRSLSE